MSKSVSERRYIVDLKKFYAAADKYRALSVEKRTKFCEATGYSTSANNLNGWITHAREAGFTNLRIITGLTMLGIDTSFASADKPSVNVFLKELADEPEETQPVDLSKAETILESIRMNSRTENEKIDALSKDIKFCKEYISNLGRVQLETNRILTQILNEVKNANLHH